MKVWCVEDDAVIRDTESFALEMAGYETRSFENGSLFFAALQSEIPDLVVLDIMLPGQDGVEILKTLKAAPQYSHLPVIMATAKGQEYDKLQSLNIGADDYLVKPFSMLELATRVKVVLRRCKVQPQQILQSGGIVMHLEEHTVTAEGQPVTLTFKEYEILKLFLQNPRAVLSREQLFLHVWGEDFVGESRTIDMHIRTLRQKLGNCGEQIKTVIGVGYRLEDGTT